jgi:hypothetical protein
MVIQAEITARLRADLSGAVDESFTDDQLACHIQRALREFSDASPLVRETRLPQLSELGSAPLSSFPGLVRLLAVESPPDQLPPSLIPASVSGEYIAFESASPGPCLIRWAAVHELNEHGSSLDACDAELITMGAMAFALLQCVTPESGQVGDERLANGRARLTAFRQLLDERRPAITKGGRIYRVRRIHDSHAYSASSSLRASGTRR